MNQLENWNFMIIMRDSNTKIRKGKKDFVVNSYSLEVRDEKEKRFVILFYKEHKHYIMNTFYKFPKR